MDMQQTSGDSGIDRMTNFLVYHREFLKNMFDATDTEYLQALANALGHLTAHTNPISQDDLIAQLHEITVLTNAQTRKKFEGEH